MPSLGGAIARLGDQYRNSRREMEIYASLSLALMHSEGSSERVREAFSAAGPGGYPGRCRTSPPVERRGQGADRGGVACAPRL
jgi:hypothetical protein